MLAKKEAKTWGDSPHSPSGDGSPTPGRRWRNHGPRSHPHAGDGPASPGADGTDGGGRASGRATAAGSRATSPNVGTRADAAGAAGGGGGGGGDQALEEQVRSHLAATEALIESRRAQLDAEWRSGRANGVSATVVAREVEEAKRRAAIEFAVSKFVPHKLAMMAHNMHVPKQELEAGGGGGGGRGGGGAGGWGRGWGRGWA